MSALEIPLLSLVILKVSLDFLTHTFKSPKTTASLLYNTIFLKNKNPLNLLKQKSLISKMRLTRQRGFHPTESCLEP